MNRKIVAAIIVSLLVGAGIGYGTSTFVYMQTPSTLQHVTIALDWVIYGVHEYYFAALDKGYYLDEGLSVDILRGYGSMDTLKRVATGSVDFGFVSASSTIIGMDNNPDMKVKTVAGIYLNNPDNICYVTGGSITTPQDLKGKTIGTGSGSSEQALLPAYIHAIGLNASDVTVLGMDDSALYSALIMGQVDAITAWPTELPMIESMGNQAGKHVGMFSWQDAGISTYANGIIATVDTIQNRPDVVRRFVKATLRGLAYTWNHIEDAANILVKYNPEVNVTEAIAEFNATKVGLIETPEIHTQGLGIMLESKWNSTVTIIDKYIGLNKEPNPSDLYTLAFLPSPPIMPP